MGAYLEILGIGPVVVDRGEGPYLFNPQGTRYINGNSGVWNVAAGLGREKLVEAACDQMRKLAFAPCWQMVHPAAIELAAKLVEITGGRYQHVMYGSNGSDAVEAALKMSRQYHRQSPDPVDRKRYKIFSLRGSYHGFSYGCISTSGQQYDAEKYGPLIPGFVQVDPPYCYRCPFGKAGYPGCELACAQALEQAIELEGPETVAALIIEPVMGDFGIVAGPDAYYTRVAEICHKYGMLLIADEVTTGFGRTGKLFATLDWNPQPDILCLGKAITNGYFPLSATLATETIFQRFLGQGKAFAHGVTHGGHPVGCVVAMAAIETMTGEKLPEHAAQVGEHLRCGLEGLQEKRPEIGEVRGRGLMWAIELVKDRRTREPYTVKETHDIFIDIAMAGLLISARANQLRMLPPLIIDEALADEMVRIIDRGLDMHFTSVVAKKMRMLKEFVVSKTGM
jgi:adenosylmethionine-8-amino-7-oxononanoate aminotransferase